MVASLRTAIIALCIGAMLGMATGWTLRGDHEAAQQLDAARASIKATAQAQESVDGLALIQAEQNATQAQADRIITKEVIRYVQVTPPADRCTLPGPWRLHHDAAATGTPADPARLADGQADPVTDAAALATVADNYGDCRHYIRQVEGWQAWWQTAKPLCQGVVP